MNSLRSLILGLGLMGCLVNASHAADDYWVDSKPLHSGTRVWIDVGQGAEQSTLEFPKRHYLMRGSTRVGVARPQANGGFTGFAFVDGQVLDFSASDGQRVTLLGARKSAEAATSFRCGSEHIEIPDEVRRLARGEVAPSRRADRGGLLDAVVAVDTDNEFNFEKFNNNQTAAMNWLADLFTAMNVMYQRDIGINLILGDVILRLDLDNPPTFDDDPWVLNSSPADQNLLSEFGSFWSANMGSIDRVFAMLLSGKSPSPNSSSGIAWVDGWCETQNIGGGYSVTQVFTANIAVENDVRVIAHEIGHNAGSPHTHCYSPPVDTCFSGEMGCYSGGTSCPAGGNGTMMSYCHFGSGCGTPNLIEFHPTVIDLFDTFIANHIGSCLIPPVDLIFADSLEDLP